jgi:RNA polymerase sigma-70 factor, ECF subfamily
VSNWLSTAAQFCREYPNSLGAPVQVVAANLTHDHLRAHNVKKRGGDFDQIAYDSDALGKLPSVYGHESLERHMQITEIEATLRGLSKHQAGDSRDRTIFWLHFQLGMSANAIARISKFKLTSKGVESSLRRTLSSLKKIVG